MSESQTSGKKHPPESEAKSNNASSPEDDDGGVNLEKNGTASSTEEEANCSSSKRRKIDQDEGDLKPAALPTKSDEPSNNERPHATNLPLAPTLEEYLKPTAYLVYRPRPEWIHPSPPHRTDDSNHHPSTEYYARPSSPLPSASLRPRPPAGTNFVHRVRTEVFGPFAEWLDRELRQREVEAHEIERLENALIENDIEAARRELRLVRGEAEIPQFWRLGPEVDGPEVDGGGLRDRDEVGGVAAAGGNADNGGLGSGGDALGEARRDGDSETLLGASENKVAVYGNDYDSALHLAIKHGPPEAALALIKNGANVDFPNAKGVTPLMSASLEGNIEVVRALLERGASPNAIAIRGSTALIQACHFGKLEVVKELIKHGASLDQANYKNTTALMRASQEGHEDVVKLLLQHDSFVNRRNDERMSALMLCSQRGHAGVVKMLIKAGAEVDAVTNQNSTSLMLAIKRKHFEVAKILVASGTELMLKDSKDRTVLETSQKRGLTKFAEILTCSAQVRLMQEEARKTRNLCMVRIWTLLQSERAHIKILNTETTIHKMAENLDNPLLYQVSSSKRALIRAMTMPAPVMELITSFVPLPLLYEKRLQLLASRSQVDPDSAVYNAMDLIDEVLELGGLLQAFDAASVAPPDGFPSWTTFQKWCGRCDVILARRKGEHTEGVASLDESSIAREISGTAKEQRRSINYLQVLANAPPALTLVLKSNPYEMPSLLLDQLKNIQDIQSLVRRRAGVHFDTTVANEIVTIARMSVNWCESRPTY